MTTFTDPRIGASMLVPWDAGLVGPYSLEWDNTLETWDAGTTTWDGGTTVWGYPAIYFTG